MTDVIKAMAGCSKDEAFMRDVFKELIRARSKFPEQSTEHTLIGLVEEVGELSEAFLDAYVISQQHRKGRTEADVRKEAIQVAVMAFRVALDCRRPPL